MDIDSKLKMEEERMKSVKEFLMILIYMPLYAVGWLLVLWVAVTIDIFCTLKESVGGRGNRFERDKQAKCKENG